MKNIYTLIVLLFASFNCMGQYYPMLDSISNVWYFNGNIQPVRVQQPAQNCNYGNSFLFSSMRLYTTNDTTISNVDYKILMKQDWNSPTSECTFGYLREDTVAQQVYFMDNIFNPEIILYDFSLQVGDTIQYNFVNPGGYYTDGTYSVDSIGTITINAGQRRIFYLSTPGSFNQYPMEWIESVGHPGHTIFNYSDNFWGGLLFWCNDIVARDFSTLLSCFEHGPQKVYFDSCAHAIAFNNFCFDYQDSCEYWNICGSLEEVGVVNSFNVVPNPAGDVANLIVSANRDASADLSCIDIRGKRIFNQRIRLGQGKNELAVPVSKLAPGMYFFELRLENSSVYQKLVKQ